MKRMVARIVMFLIAIGGGLLIIKVAQHQLNNIGETLIEQHQERRDLQKKVTAQQQSEAAAIDQKNRDLEAQKAIFESKRRSAFDKAYITPEGCEAPRSQRQLTECVNDKMRAKRAFMANYGPAPGLTPPNLEKIQYGEAK